jgi:hypothetical protein
VIIRIDAADARPPRVTQLHIFNVEARPQLREVSRCLSQNARGKA